MTLPLTEKPQEDLLPQTTVQIFGEVIRDRLGLAQPARNPAILRRRLRATMEAAAATDSLAFVEALRDAGDDSHLFQATADVVPNRETSFFRDVGQLRSLVCHVLPGIYDGGSLRVLSAGCATGEEVYSLAMLGMEEMYRFPGGGLRVTGLDVSAKAIEFAREGLYGPGAIAKGGKGPDRWQGRYFRQEGGRYKVREMLRASTSFIQGNLISAETLRGADSFDAVVCRNVLIYFDDETLRRTVDRLLGLLRQGGVLLLGQAEAGLVTHLDHCRHRIGDLVWFERQET